MLYILGHCMKIDFLGRYNELNSALSKPRGSPVPKGGSDFGTLLGSLLGNAPLSSARTDGYSANSLNKSALSGDDIGGPRAQFTFRTPELTSPKLSAIEAPPELIEVVKEPSPGVKTMGGDGRTLSAPKIVEAKRIEHQASLMDLKKLDRIQKIHDMVAAASTRQGIDPSLSMAVISTESDFDPKAVSTDGFGSKGLFQLLDSTGKHLHEESEVNESYDPFNPEMNVELGVNYLRKLHDLFSQNSDLGSKGSTHQAENSSSLEKLAVAAFNAGEGRVASAQERAIRDGKDPSKYESVETYLPESTRDYVKKVLAARPQFEGASIG